MLEIKFIETISMETKDHTTVRNEYVVGVYKVRELLHTYSDGSTFRNFDVYKTVYADEFAPTIYFQNSFFNDHEFFEIQTTSYGALSLDKFKKYVEAQKYALEVVEAITEKFINK